MNYDGLHECAQCGEYTVGTLCNACWRQAMIDNDPNPPPIIECWCALCGIPTTGKQSGKDYVDCCPSCAEEVRQMAAGQDGWDSGLVIHAYFTD